MAGEQWCDSTRSKLTLINEVHSMTWARWRCTVVSYRFVIKWRSNGTFWEMRMSSNCVANRNDVDLRFHIMMNMKMVNPHDYSRRCCNAAFTEMNKTIRKRRNSREKKSANHPHLNTQQRAYRTSTAVKRFPDVQVFLGFPFHFYAEKLFPNLIWKIQNSTDVTAFVLVCSVPPAQYPLALAPDLAVDAFQFSPASLN